MRARLLPATKMLHVPNPHTKQHNPKSPMAMIIAMVPIDAAPLR
jgi:hypothetical protein